MAMGEMHTHRCAGCGGYLDCDDPWCTATDVDCEDCTADRHGEPDAAAESAATPEVPS